MIKTVVVQRPGVEMSTVTDPKATLILNNFVRESITADEKDVSKANSLKAYLDSFGVLTQKDGVLPTIHATGVGIVQLLDDLQDILKVR